jgi:hypothetical protein
MSHNRRFDAASRDHFRLWHFSDMANLAACPLLTEKQKYFHSICDWPLLAQSCRSQECPFL